MKLTSYQQKRHFNKTPEPKGSKISSQQKSKNLFIIQKHAASHLHYDFRLELNGVLLSWAVPKGPSLNPAIKRLAMHVEDHPVEYGSFEGNIPKGEYGGGAVMLWDKGTWHCDDPNPTQAYKKGHLSFDLKAKKLNGKWKLIRMNNNDKTWLLMKANDEYANSSKNFDITVEEPDSVVSNRTIDEIAQNKSTNKKTKKVNLLKELKLSSSKFPHIIYPELATLVDKAPSGNEWLHEIKFDGYRLLIFKNKNKTQIFTRNHQDWTHKFKSIEKEVNKIFKENIILDGEVVVFDKNHHSNFQLLQNSIKENSNDFYYYIFDLLYYDKYNLMELPLLKRKEILENLLSEKSSQILLFSDHVIDNGKQFFKKACQLGLEGIVSKKIDSEYLEKRSKSWLKVKCIKRQEFIIIGFNKSDKRNYFRSLLLGIHDKNGELIYCGNVGTGFNQESLKSIYALLEKNITPKMPLKIRPPASKNVTWVKPVIIAEVEFTEWTDSGILRHPSFKGIRSDKSPKKITREVETSINQVDDANMTPHIKLSHPEKILYPEDKITKKEVAEYYEFIKDWMLPYIINRPLSLVRCPSNYKQCFFQKHIEHKPPSGIHEITIKEKEGKGQYLYLDSAEGLLSLAQLNVLEIHPWSAHIDNIEYPDMVTFDLDPAPNVPWKKIITAAFEIKAFLENLKLKSFIKTTGGKGLHVIIPVKPEYDWDDISLFAHTLVDYMVKNNSDTYIGKMTKSARTNKIFLDYLRNKRGATAIAPYSLRARKEATVATPISWDELTTDRRDTFFTIKTIMKRLLILKQDPWKDFLKIKQSLNLDQYKTK